MKTKRSTKSRKSHRPGARPAPEAPTGPSVCPGLSIIAGALIFTDCLGFRHDLSHEPWLNTREASYRLKCHPETMLRKVRTGELYPVIYVNSRTVHVYECAIRDFTIRRTAGAARLLTAATRAA